MIDLDIPTADFAIHHKDHLFVLFYYILVVLVVTFLIYHTIGIQLVATAEFPTDIPTYICPIANLHEHKEPSSFMRT